MKIPLRTWPTWPAALLLAACSSSNPATSTVSGFSVVKVRDLMLAPMQGESPHVSAASALLKMGDVFYVAVDDEQYLAEFPTTGGGLGKRWPIVSGALPSNERERKASKLDIEALVQLPAFGGYPDGAVLLVGSGSKPARERIFLARLAHGGGLSDGLPETVDASKLFERIRQWFPEVNIEGAAISADTLMLFQRGNGAAHDNAVLLLELTPLLEALAQHRPLTGKLVRKTLRHSVGSIDGVALSFSDATALSGGQLLYAAVAENSASTSTDGPCMGSRLGILNSDGTRLGQEVEIPGNWKVEGLAAEQSGNVLTVWMVADGDDRAVAAPLLKATWVLGDRSQSTATH